MQTSNMPSNSSLIVGLSGEIVKKISGGGNKSNRDSGEEILLLLLAVAILFTIAIAPLKILLRKNFGNNTISTLETIAGAVFFGIFAWAALGLAIENSGDTHTNIYEAYFLSPITLGLIAVIFLTVAITVLIKGFREGSKNRFNHNSNWLADNFRGDSILFGKYVKDVELQLKVWKRLEPEFCIKWSFILLLIHPLLGGPFLFSSIAFAINEFYHVKFKWEKLITEQKGNTSKANSTFSESYAGGAS